MSKSAYEMNITEYINSTDTDDRYEFESHVFEMVWSNFTKHLPDEKDKNNDYAHNNINVWYNADADEILCRSEELAEMIANIIESISGEKMAHTGYYDPEEDERDDCVDGRTGWYYIDFD